MGAQNYLVGKREQSKKLPTVCKSRVDTVTAEQHDRLISLLQNTKAVQWSQLPEGEGLYLDALHPCRATKVEKKQLSISRAE